EPVVHNHVCLLHESHGSKGQQFRVTGPSAYQIHLSLDRFFGFIFKFALQPSLCRLILAREYHFRKRSLQYPLPEPAALRRLRETVFYPATELASVSSQAAVSRRDHGFQTRSQQPC